MTPRKDLLGLPEFKNITPKTSRNDMTKSMIEFENDLMLPPGASSSRVAETPQALNDISFIINGPETPIGSQINNTSQK